MYTKRFIHIFKITNINDGEWEFYAVKKLGIYLMIHIQNLLTFM